MVRRAPDEAQLLHRLDEAIAAWWRRREYPSSALLRAGLMALEAGIDLPSEHRTLLLHTALYRRRGVVTALRHQDDAERTGFVVAEALTTAGVQTPIELVRAVAERDPNASAWRRTLLDELRTVTVGPDRERAVLAARAYEALTSGRIATVETVPEDVPLERGAQRKRPRLAMRQMLWLTALVCVIGVGFAAIMLRSQQTKMVEVRAGEFVLAGEGSSTVSRLVKVEPFRIDRFEVTNREYRRCYERGACDWPSDSHLVAPATRIENYFIDPAFDTHPVVNVSQQAAITYCDWLGKRLPTEAEWLTAAVAATATDRLYKYPWGDMFDSNRANTVESGRGVPVAVGSHSPAGDSPSGVADMAGNVAEWTSTVSEDGASAAAKGGSYKDSGIAARGDASILVPISEAVSWIGFRCARD